MFEFGFEEPTGEKILRHAVEAAFPVRSSRRPGREPGNILPRTDPLRGQRHAAGSARPYALPALRTGSSLAHGIRLFLQRSSPRHRSQTSHWPGASGMDRMDDAIGRALTPPDK